MNNAKISMKNVYSYENYFFYEYKIYKINDIYIRE